MSRRSPDVSVVGTYVYCIGYAEALGNGDSPVSAPAVGSGDTPVRIIQYRDLAAVVSDATTTEYDPSRQNLLSHQRVLEEVMEHADVLPLVFGSVARSDDQVRELLLKEEFEQLHAYLEYVRGRVELDLRVLWNRDQLFAEIVAESPEIRDLQEALADQPVDAMYYERITLGEMTAAIIAEKSEEEAQALLDGLESLAVEVRLNEDLTDMMILSAAFLVDRAQMPTFDAAIQELDAIQNGRLVFHYIGPLPPYSFVDLQLLWNE